MKQLLRLEQYTLKRPGEVLLVTAQVDEELDQIMVFKGFSSSLMKPTAFDPDIPVLPANAVIVSIDRLQSPYRPETPRYIQQALSWDQMRSHLEEVGV
ncbi:MAG: hypothetical protein NW220_19105 [Leptolyngbyaceae cyanobacterium bins.349]|nr:hypothetical protein [Leptolyngbyaceae cyanobacterium bins.349]